MKQVKTFIAIAAFIFAGANVANAQATASKVCHVASQEVVEAHPKAKAAEKQLRDLAKTYESQLAEMDKELKSKFAVAQEQAPTKSDEENERVMQELQSGQKKLEDYYSNSQKSMAQKREDLLKPLYKEVREAIFKVARAKGFDYVLDSTTGTGIIMADGYDITPDVKADLNIKS